MYIDQQDRADIQEILKRRANEIAFFKDRPGAAFPGSVEMALTREIERIRRLADAVNGGVGTDPTGAFTDPTGAFTDPTGAFIDALKKGTLQQCVHGDWVDVNNLEAITVGYLVRADKFRIVNEQ